MNIPIIPNFSFLLNRGNDLTEFFWPMFYWVKEQLITNHQVPLWNSSILSGTPLVSDPQAPIFYPLNIPALFMPLDTFFIFSFITHLVIGLIGAYLCSNKGLAFSKKTSVILAFLYIFAPKFFAQTEAGHVGLIYSMAWIPFIFFFSLKLREKPNIKIAIYLAISLALLYYSHLPTFLIISISSGLIALTKKSLKYLAVSAILTFGLTAISLLPQVGWQKESTRYLLLADKDVYPKWSSVFEAAKAIFISNPDTEKAITIGSLPAFLAVLGFLKLKNKSKVLILAVSFGVILITLNNASPIYSILLKQDWYLLLRVSTRFWILITLTALYLIGTALEKYKSKVIFIFALLSILESFFWGITYLAKPTSKNPNLAPKRVYEYLSKDQSHFRVYCLTKCLSQKEAVIYNLELLNGYSTLQQSNFYKHAWQLTGTYWNYYTLSIPPFGADTQNPDVKSLGEYNVKYLISKDQIVSKNVRFKIKLDNFLIYENLLFVPRNYEIYSPNFIRVGIKSPTKQIIIPEVYSPGWAAYLNGTEKVPVLETPNSLRAVDIKNGTDFVDFRYSPTSFKYGAIITLATIIFIIMALTLKPKFLQKI